MDRTEERDLLDRARPSCQTCGVPVQRIEIPWKQNGDGDWVLDQAMLVCFNEHRHKVMLFDRN